MWKRILKILIAIVVVSLIVGGYFFAIKVRKQMLLFAVGSNELFHGKSVSFNYDKQQIVSEKFTSIATQKLALGEVLLNYDFISVGKVFPKKMSSDFIEITSNATFSLDLSNKTVNGATFEELTANIADLIKELSINNEEYANFKMNCNLELINFKGEKKTAPATFLVSQLSNGDLLFALNFDNYRVKSFVDSQSGLIFGEYSAYQQDFEFIDFNFGLPTLFHLNSNELIVGNFKYDLKKRAFEFITGESKFTRDATIKGSILSLHGLSHGTISWEYFNKNRWKVTLNDAVMVLPLRARLTNLVFSQDEEGFNGINFNGEIEFYHNAFKELLGFEQPRNSALLKHHLIGKWDLDTNCWEVNRLNSSGYAPMIKAKYRNYDLLFNPNSFKLSGAGEKSENVSFSYELTFDNAELKKDDTYFVAYNGKLVGDCELKMTSEDTFEPYFKGSLAFGSVDGKYRQFNYSGHEIKLQFGDDRIDEASDNWQISAVDATVKSENLPDLKFYNLIGNVKLFRNPDESDLNSMVYLNLAGSKMEAGTMLMEQVAFEGGLNLLPNWTIRKALLEMSAASAKNGEVKLEKVRSELMIDRTKKQLACDGKLDISADNLEYVKPLKLHVEKPLCHIEFNFVLNSNQILNRQISFSGEKGNFDVADKLHGTFASVDTTLDYPNLYKASATDFTVKGDNIFIACPRVVGSLAMNSQNGNFTAINGTYNGGGKFDCCLNFDWSKLFSNKILSLSNSSMHLDELNFDGMGGLLQLDWENNIFELTSNIKNLKFRSGEFENVQSSVVFNRDKLLIKRLLTQLGEGKIELSDKSDQQNLIFNATNVACEKILAAVGLPDNMIQGIGKAEFQMRKSEKGYELVSLKIESGRECRINMQQFNEFAEDDKTVKSELARMSFEDFKSNYVLLELNETSSGIYNIVITSTGRSGKLLPFEFDIGSGELKKVNHSLFNLETTIKLLYKGVKVEKIIKK